MILSIDTEKAFDRIRLTYDKNNIDKEHLPKKKKKTTANIVFNSQRMNAFGVPIVAQQ